MLLFCCSARTCPAASGPACTTGSRSERPAHGLCRRPPSSSHSAGSSPCHSPTLLPPRPRAPRHSPPPLSPSPWTPSSCHCSRAPSLSSRALPFFLVGAKKNKIEIVPFFFFR